MSYAALIKPIVPNHDPRLIEAWMRLDHPTLDALSPEYFAEEARLAAKCVDRAGVAKSEELARAMGV